MMTSEATTAATPCRLVSFLGTGKWNKEAGRYEYEPVPYRYGGSNPVETPWIVQALCTLIEPQPTEIRVLRTEGAKTAVGDRFEADMRTWCKTPVEFVDGFPEDGDEQSLWRQFEIIKEQLRAPAGYSVILDITHGFRSFPFFGGAVAAFVRAVDPEPCPLRIVYGAFEARKANGGVAPIWDLTPFVDLLDWTREIMLFLKTGQVQEVARHGEALGRSLAKVADPDDRPVLRKLIKDLESFGNDLATIRTGALLLGEQPTAASLLRTIDETRGKISRELPPLADVLDRIRDMCEPLVSLRGPLNTKSGQQACLALARLYLAMGRYGEAASIAREGWISLYAPDQAAIPGQKGFSMPLREQGESDWFSFEQNDAKTAGRVRNDILHAGFRNQPAKAKRLIDQISKLVNDFSRAQRKAAPMPAAGGPAIFVNLTNHPSAEWEDAQRRAALALAPTLVDLTFPTVPPDADEEAIDALAKETTGRLPAGASHVLLQGEWTLTVALLRALQGRRLTCLAATTDRDVTVDADGAKTSHFRFVRFRRYADA